MDRMDKEETIQYLRDAQAKLRDTTDKGEALEVLREAGIKTGYKPAMRALIYAQPEEKWIKW